MLYKTKRDVDSTKGSEDVTKEDLAGKQGPIVTVQIKAETICGQPVKFWFLLSVTLAVALVFLLSLSVAGTYFIASFPIFLMQMLSLYSTRTQTPSHWVGLIMLGSEKPC